MKNTSIRLPVDLLKRAKLRALEEETSLQQLIIEGLEARLEKRPAKAGGRK